MYLGGLCFITDNKASRLSYEAMVIEALKAGVRWIQYRDKEGSRGEIFRKAVELRSITRDYDAILIVNDHPDIALAADADGVHLGQDDLPLKEARKILGENRLIGISTHKLDHAINAGISGADYIGFGPIFQTATKDAGMPKGISLLRKIKSEVRLPVVGIGGIKPENARSVFEAGADAVAVASAILSGDIGENAKRFLEIIRSYEIVHPD
jgi:thiamine-phosphate pyrophosphorylase